MREGGVFEIQRSLIEFLASVVLVAMAINLITDALPDDQLAVWLKLAFATIALILVSVFWVFKARRSLQQSYLIRALAFFDEKNSEFTIAHDYDFSEKMRDYLSSATSENSDLKHEYESSKTKSTESDSRILPNVVFYSIVRDAAEYYAISRLSTFLSDYFNGTEVETIDYDRENFSSLVTTNRFIDIFTRPMSQRRAFSAHPESDGVVSASEEGPRKVVLAFGPDGVMFEALDFRLPKGSTVSRTSKDTVTVTTRGFHLKIQAKCDGYTGVVSPVFAGRLVGLDWSDLWPIHVSFALSYQVDWHSFFFFLLKRRTFWVEEFCAEMTKEADFDAFQDRIGWPTIETMEIMSRTRRVPQRRAKTS